MARIKHGIESVLGVSNAPVLFAMAAEIEPKGEREGVQITNAFFWQIWA